MAFTRRAGRGFESTIWPGFVDALTALLLILMFVLSIFMIVQFSLRETILGQESRLDQQEETIDRQISQIGALSAQIQNLAGVLALEQGRSETLEDEVATLSGTLEESREAAATAEEKAATLEALIVDMREAAADREAEARTLAAERSELEALVASLRDEAAERETEAETQAERLARMQAETQALDAAVSRLEEERARQARTLETLEGEADAQTAARARLDAERAAALTLVATAAAGDGAEARIAALDRRIAAAEGPRAVLAEEAATAVALVSGIEGVDVGPALPEGTLDGLSGQRREVDALKEAAVARIEARLAAMSPEERERRRAEADRAVALARVEALEARLGEEARERRRLSALRAAAERRLAEQAETIEETEAQVLERAAAAAALRRDLERRTRELNQRRRAIANAEERIAMLESMLGEVDADRRASAREVAAQQAAVERLNSQVSALRRQVGSLQSLLGAAEQEQEAAEVQIEQLGARLNAALAERVSDLERFRSVFFEQMERVLGGRQDIKRDGDRFVFQSEVLFDAGSASLGAAGRRELAKLGAVLRDLERAVPDELDWILRVDGHTDRVPISGGRYADNWELSQARALSVVRYLIDEQRVPPDRLAATGFGEHRPMDTRNTPQAYARNRRIEFKFTER